MTAAATRSVGSEYHVADTFDVTGNDRVAELAQAAQAWNGNADLREPDAAASRPVAQQCQCRAKHPADGFDGQLCWQRQALGVMQFARQAADADAEPLTGQLNGCERHRAVERHETRWAADVR